MRFNDKGQEVRRVQQALLDGGYSLPRYGVDGHLGAETWDTLRHYAGDHSSPWDPEVPKGVLALLAKPDPPVEVPDTPDTPELDVPVVDLRGDQSNPPAKSRKFKLAGGAVVERNPAMVTGITIHQTAVPYGVAEYQVQAAGGDRELALARRSLDVACHVMAFRSGFVAWPNPLRWYVHHGNGFNSTELGLEIDGRYPGLIGGDTWDGKPATEATDELVSAARAAVALMVREGRAAGMPIRFIHAHRQSSSSRRSDPGEELWRRVVLEYAVPELGLVTEPAKVLGSGRPIPTQWDPDGVGDY